MRDDFDASIAENNKLINGSHVFCTARFLLISKEDCERHRKRKKAVCKPGCPYLDEC